MKRWNMTTASAVSMQFTAELSSFCVTVSAHRNLSDFTWGDVCINWNAVGNVNLDAARETSEVMREAVTAAMTRIEFEIHQADILFAEQKRSRNNENN